MYKNFFFPIFIYRDILPLKEGPEYDFTIILGPNIMGPVPENFDIYIPETLKGGYHLMKSLIHTPLEKKKGFLFLPKTTSVPWWTELFSK